MCMCASEREKARWEGNTLDRRHLDTLDKLLVQHALPTFLLYMVGALGNVILIRHPEVIIKELEMATAHTKLKAE